MGLSGHFFKQYDVILKKEEEEVSICSKNRKINSSFSSGSSLEGSLALVAATGCISVFLFVK